jgi:tetratricopeptide (TPR) repeat protein
MPQPHTVVIPFGVPVEGRGLGIGLAALVHAFANVEGEGVAIAQLHAKQKDEPPEAKPSPVEAFVPPAAWNDLAKRGDAPPQVHVVVTGAIEPPALGSGTIQLLAFDPRDGKTRAKVEATFDAVRAGASLVGALEQLWSKLDGAIGGLVALGDLEWEPLESVLRAERCALHDPLRGGPHDRLAAMLHLGRAIGDAPDARYPVERLAALGLEAASGSGTDPKLAAAAARALERASEDAPGHVELAEALAAVLLRQGRARDAERQLNAALTSSPRRARLHMLLAQSLRAQGQLDAALAALQTGQADAGADIGLFTERGAVLAARGDLDGAKAAWREALAIDPIHPAPFTSLGAVALRTKDGELAQHLVDAALTSPRTSVDVLRRSIHLALATEGEGIARASRVARLCLRVLDLAPADPWAALALARSLMVLGETAQARERLLQVERSAPGSSAAAEAHAVRVVLDDPQLEAQLQSVIRASQSEEGAALTDVAVRARRLATLHGLWPAWVAAATAERRRGVPAAARAALMAALEVAPGAAVAHADLAELLAELGETQEARDHVRRAVELEGETPRTTELLAKLRAPRPSKPPPEPAGWTERLSAAWNTLRRR